MEIGGCVDARVLDRGAHAVGGNARVDGGPEFLGEKVARVGGADREPLASGRPAAVGLAREDRRVRAHQALGAAGPDDGDALGDRLDLLPGALGQQQLERERRERAREVVDAPVALGFAEDGHDVLGAERPLVEEARRLAHVIGSPHTNLERLSVHTRPPPVLSL